MEEEEGLPPNWKLGGLEAWGCWGGCAVEEEGLPPNWELGCSGLERKSNRGGGMEEGLGWVGERVAVPFDLEANSGVSAK